MKWIFPSYGSILASTFKAQSNDITGGPVAFRFHGSRTLLKYSGHNMELLLPGLCCHLPRLFSTSITNESESQAKTAEAELKLAQVHQFISEDIADIVRVTLDKIIDMIEQE